MENLRVLAAVGKGGAWRPLLAALVLMSLGGCLGRAQEPEAALPQTLLSPDGSLALGLDWEGGGLAYWLSLEGDTLVRPSRLGVVAREADFGRLALDSFRRYARDQEWEQLWGEHGTVRDRCEGLELFVRNPAGQRLELEFRLYNDGLGFRYRFPEQQGLDSLNIVDELTTIALAGDPRAWWIDADPDSYEKLYHEGSASELDSASTPATFRFGSGAHLSVHEAALVDYPEMFLRGQAGALKAELVPWPDGTLVKTRTGARSPWRVLIVGRDAGDLVESTLVLNLNEPPAAGADYSWVRPTRYMGIWWEIHLGESSWIQGPRHGANTQNMKRYIDFAAQNGIGAVLAEGWNVGWEEWGANQSFDQITPYPDFDLEGIVAYGKDKGVEFIGHHETGGDAAYYETVMEAAFERFHALGMRAVKTGYAGGITPKGHSHHGQWMVRHYQRVVDAAARHQIMLDVHEPIKPTGLCRTYPNLMTGEGVRGMEWNAWSQGNPPSHTVTLPFTRMLAGPLDYTPGIFDVLFENSDSPAVEWSQLPKDSVRVHTTLTKQLALFVILYSPLQMAADKPSNYQGHPCFRFIASCPTDWDQSVVPLAEVGDHICVARRSGSDWFVGAATDEQARALDLPLDFLKEGASYRCEIFREAEGADWLNRPAEYQIEERELRRGDSLRLDLPAGGGWAMILREQ